MSAKINAIATYILVSIFIVLIEYLYGVPLNIYHYLDIFLEEFSNKVTPIFPTTGNWSDPANDVKSGIYIVRFFLHVLLSPIPLIAATIVYLKHEKESMCW